RTSKVVPMATLAASSPVRKRPAATSSAPPATATCVRRPAARNLARPVAINCSAFCAAPLPAPTDSAFIGSAFIGSEFVGSEFVNLELIGALLPLTILMYVQQARVPPEFKFRNIV